VSESLTNDTKAILLLCGFFGEKRAEKPLSLGEYTVLARWLKNNKMYPRDLLQEENAIVASRGSGIEEIRLKSLLDRGFMLGVAVEEWKRNGIWVLSRSDSDYPTRYKKRLGEKSPPILYGVGDRSLLKGGGLAMVGSRNVDREGEDFTRRVAEMCATRGMPVVSGAARGVDRIAMVAALEAKGIAIGVLAGDLLKKSVEKDYRNAISEGRLLLISPYNPNAPFSVGAAMGRNKLVYSMSSYCLVVSSDYEKGGTWAGAKEELKRKKPLPVFVRTGDNVPKGNLELLKLGAAVWPKSIDRDSFYQELKRSFFKSKSIQPMENLLPLDFKDEDSSKKDTMKNRVSVPKEPSSIYQAVLPVILGALREPMSSKDLAAKLDVGKGQLDKWLKRAVNEDKKVVKLKGPVRYQSVDSLKSST
jgi:predicted Rossmann fold nucleotide-binding protein DprA/Smf involved in DNA uptake